MNADVIGRALHVPYLPGGRTLDGWDCYGAVRWVYHALTGVLLPEFPTLSHESHKSTQRAAWSLHECCTPCDFAPLTFAAQYKGKRWVHIGLVLPNRQILHAYEDKPRTVIERRNKFELLAPITKYYQWSPPHGNPHCLPRCGHSE